MTVKVFERIAGNLVSNGTISAEDKEIYEYGLKRIATTILNAVTTLIIGFIFCMIWQSILFMVSYVPLRSYVGGYHARTPLRCYIFSIILTVCVLLSIKYIPHNNILFYALTIISGAVVFVFAPIGDENKPLDETEIKVFKKRTKIILFTEIVLIILFLILKLNFISTCLIISLVCASFMLILSVLKSVIIKSKNRNIKII